MAENENLEQCGYCAPVNSRICHLRQAMRVTGSQFRAFSMNWPLPLK